MKKRILYSKPSISELEIHYATDAVTNGWGDNCYAYIDRFENIFKDHLCVDFSIATSSCTGALHMGLAALGIGPGDEVILADSNWIATVAPVVYLGATPVFVDILQDSWCLDPEKVEKAITLNTKAIIATHLYGNLCDISKLLFIGKAYGIPIVEDAAEAIGSSYQNKPAGSMGTFGVFSFHGTKTITTGEGGMFVTNDIDLYEKVLTLSNHGRSKQNFKQFKPDLVGYKYKMSNIQAAIGCAQLERIDEIKLRKREIFFMYKELLGCIEGIAMNPEPSDVINGYWMPTVVFDLECGVTQEKLKEHFNLENIDARVFFSPLSDLPMFKAVPENINSFSIPKRAINLPSFHDMCIEDIYRITKTILNIK